MASPDPHPSTQPQRTSIYLSKVWVFFWAPVLFVIGIGGLIAGIVGVSYSSEVLLAHNWPVNTAHLDSCEAVLTSGRHSDYWQFSARWSYGPGLARHFEDVWTPDDAPRYAPLYPPETVDPAQTARIRTRYCNAPETTQLRISPTHPDQAVMNTDVTDGSWISSMVGSLIAVLGGLTLIGGAVTLWRKRLKHVPARQT
jgi:hypothetical protein